MPDDNTPLYTIGTAAELLGVHPRTLRLYEQGGLMKPARRNNRRFYSNNDLRWIQCIRHLIHQKGLNQEGLRRLLALAPCWEIRGCPKEERDNCTAYVDNTVPCWQIASAACADEKKCHECRVYLGAREEILAREKLGETEEYII